MHNGPFDQGQTITRDRLAKRARRVEHRAGGVDPDEPPAWLDTGQIPCLEPTPSAHDKKLFVGGHRLLFAVATDVLVEAAQRFREPEAVQSTVMMIVATIGLLVNLSSMRLLTAGRTSA